MKHQNVAFRHEVESRSGLRAWAKGIVARINTAVSEEGHKVQMMIAQPFQF
jgi:hypothetical protein